MGNSYTHTCWIYLYFDYTRLRITMIMQWILPIQTSDIICQHYHYTVWWRSVWMRQGDELCQRTAVPVYRYLVGSVKCVTVHEEGGYCHSTPYPVLQYNTIQYNTIQYNTIQYNIVYFQQRTQLHYNNNFYPTLGWLESQCKILSM